MNRNPRNSKQYSYGYDSAPSAISCHIRSFAEASFPAGADDDSDGLNNGRELILGTGINNPDTDSDRMPDGWEVAHNLNPFVDDADDDPDFDGYSNYQEYRHGADPWSAESHPNPASVPYLLLLDD